MSGSRDGYVPTGPLDPVAAQIAAFFDTDPAWKEMTRRPVAETRAALRAATPVTGEPPMERVEDHPIAVRRGEIAIRFYRPGPRPPAIILWAHGGGFVLGSLDETDNFARALAAESACAIASVEYRLAPEHRFPTAVDDVLAAALWVSEHRGDLAGRSVPVILGGDSAGANLSTVVTRKLHEADTGRIAANVLAYPCTDSPDALSLQRFEAPFLRAAEVAWFLEQYLPDPAARTHPDFAPMHAENLGRLPPTLIITAEHDVITEQAELYGQKLSAAGVGVRVSRYPGMIHGFLTMDAFLSGAAGAAIREVGAFVSEVVA